MAKFLKIIEKEYRQYRQKILAMSPEEIWEKCSEIYFYSCLYEYFMYNEAIPYVVAKKLEHCRDVLHGCWQRYLGDEELSILSWEDIDQLIETYLQKGENTYENGCIRKTA